MSAELDHEARMRESEESLGGAHARLGWRADVSALPWFGPSRRKVVLTHAAARLMVVAAAVGGYLLQAKLWTVDSFGGLAIASILPGVLLVPVAIFGGRPLARALGQYMPATSPRTIEKVRLVVVRRPIGARGRGGPGSIAIVGVVATAAFGLASWAVYPFLVVYAPWIALGPALLLALLVDLAMSLRGLTSLAFELPRALSMDPMDGFAFGEQASRTGKRTFIHEGMAHEDPFGGFPRTLLALSMNANARRMLESAGVSAGALS